MGNWFTRLVKGEKRSATAGISSNSPELSRIFGYGSTNVTPESAMKIGAVYGCIRVLSESIAKLPFNVYEQGKSGKTLAYQHPVYNLIHNAPNEQMTAFAFWQAIMNIACLHGNGYARIMRGKGDRPESLKLFPAGTVSISVSNGVIAASTPDGIIPYYDIFHLRGLGTEMVGVSPLRYAAESMGVTLSAQTYGKNFFDNGAHIGGVLTHPGKLSDTAFAHLKESFNSSSTGLDNVAKPKILEEGMKWEKMSLAPDEAQFLQTREFGIADICRIFGVPPHKIQDLSRATFSNIEHLNIEFAQDGIMPWCVRIEQEANRKLFRDVEKGRFYTKINTNALLRGDTAARSIYYKEMFGIGAMSQNDIRELEDQNPIEGGDRYYVQGNNMVPIDKIDEVISAQTTKNSQSNG